MATTTFNDHVQRSKLMYEALKARESSLPAYVNRDDLVKYFELLSKVHQLNQEQEKLKAELKNKTQQLNIEFNALKQQNILYKKLVKLSFPQAYWVEFGINDKR